MNATKHNRESIRFASHIITTNHNTKRIALTARHSKFIHILNILRKNNSLCPDAEYTMIDWINGKAKPLFEIPF